MKPPSLRVAGRAVISMRTYSALMALFVARWHPLLREWNQS
jgi:hypothetical protein